MISTVARSNVVKRVICNNRNVRVQNKSTIKDIVSNKTGLSYQLDGTMRDGDHDMNVFGLGFLRSVSSTSHQVHTMASLRAPYSVMEEALDNLDENSRASIFWKQFGNDVRKSKQLTDDVAALGCNDTPLPASAKYVASIQRAAEDMVEGDPASKGELLLAHAYVRYLADLFGGSMLGKPTRLALGLKQEPSFYAFPPNIARDRMAYVEKFYSELNVAGAGMTEERRKQVVLEAKAAFKHNADIYKERPFFICGAMKGGAKITAGYLKERIGL